MKYVKWLLLITILLAGNLTFCQKEDASATRDILLADPTIFLNKNTYYLTGTGSGANAGSGSGFVVYTSGDLKTWKGPAGTDGGFILKRGDAFGSKGFWAPQIIKYNNWFYIAYTANEKIALAVSVNPSGPFLNPSLRPIDDTLKQIDPFIFIDDDGKKYLYHVRLTRGNRIFVAELNDDLMSIKPETLRECISATEKWENTAGAGWPVAEGPTVIKHKDLYYLIYSANDFRNPDYAVGYATSKSPLGPWIKSHDNPIIHRGIVGVNGPGHGDILAVGRRHLYYVFHTHFSEEAVSPRKTAIGELRFLKDPKGGYGKLVFVKTSFRYLSVKTQ
ncbi:MAG TPA: glycoside hydrolase family 43 protein [Bacteroidales bacterium]|nr:glycoside hydrolase family 43 protein [Bacteroidales bacterium]HPR13519.1 glycoside hydrolase family 43 protein [Bacteroidales bacterium]HRW85207.1 glycoside hydrolase family 43 protein [Bacteroidales bacterium]